MKKYFISGALILSLATPLYANEDNFHEGIDMSHLIAEPDADDPVDYGDPLEPFNRVIFEFNDILNGLFLTPFSKIYQGIFPEEVRTHVHYVLRNLREPINFVNDILEGDFTEAGCTILRFTTNTTLGVGGVFDVGTDWGLPYEYRDFGITMASWGVGEGGYIVLPILGPSTLRDAPAELVDATFDPATWFLPVKARPFSVSKAGADSLDRYTSVQSTVDQLRETSIDYYATIRSWYLEHRRSIVQRALEGEQAVKDEVADSPVPLREDD